MTRPDPDLARLTRSSFALATGGINDRTFQMVRPERFELPASWFVATRSIQLSYGRI